MGKFKESNFYKELLKLRDDMKPMSVRQKADHLWTYYKEYLFVALPLMLIVVGLIISTINANKEVMVRGIMVNISIDQAGYNYLSTDYADKLQITKDQQVLLEYINFGPLTVEGGQDVERNYNAAMGVIGEVSAKILDYMILDGYSTQFYATQEVYGDLHDIFTQEELDYLAEKDLLVYCLEEGQTEEWPAAVKIDGLPFVKKYVHSDDGVFFAISGSSQRLEACRAIWDYINAWEE